MSPAHAASVALYLKDYLSGKGASASGSCPGSRAIRLSDSVLRDLRAGHTRGIESRVSVLYRVALGREVLSDDFDVDGMSYEQAAE